MTLLFSEAFGVDTAALDERGAFNPSIVSDMPLFMDPFLLFNSDFPEYQALHRTMMDYLIFLRDHSGQRLDPGTIASWYAFPEVRQNWLGYTRFGNAGHGLGSRFARSLHRNLGVLFSDFGEETVTRGSHLEKLCLVEPGVGRDSISDFTTNLSKGFLLRYTETFAREHIDRERCAMFNVPKAHFNYETQQWAAGKFFLPRLRHDYVLLTPADLLTRDETWINYPDMVAQFERLPDSIPNEQRRASINRYFRQHLPRKAKATDRVVAVRDTILEFPVLIDQYIRLKEESGEEAEGLSLEKVRATRALLDELVRTIASELQERTAFYGQHWRSYDEALARVHTFRRYVEDQDGWRLLNGRSGPLREDDVQLFFGLLWCYTDFDVNREPNNGRGPVDFKVSYGAGDKSLIEFKLARNTSLRRNLAHQVEIYEAANRTSQSVKAIICYTREEQARVGRVLRELRLSGDKSIVVINARSDDKPSASIA